jgi:membrane protease subunit HflK
MAWNEPGGAEPPKSRRPGKPTSGIDALMSRWARKLGSGGAGGSSPVRGEWERRLPLLIAGAAAALWLFSGLYQIEAAQRGVIQRFGKFRSITETGSGVGWHFPAPIESLSKVNVSSINSIDYQSRMLTADVNLVNITCAIQFQNFDALKVLFQVRDPEATLREVSESAIREIIGQNTLESVLAGASRAAITTNTRDLIQKTLDSYGSGIRVVSVNLTEVQVPEPVQSAQRDANKAIEDRERYSKEAQAYQNDLLPRAKGTAQRQVLDAEAYKSQVIAKAEGDASRFSQLAVAYAQAPEVTRNRLYIETMNTVLSRANKIIIDAKGGNGNMLYLPLDKLLEARSSRNATTTEIVVTPGGVSTGGVSTGAGVGTGEASDTRSRERVER